MVDKKPIDASHHKPIEGLGQVLFDNAPDAQLIVDADGAITLANTMAETLFGYAREELVGAKVEILIPQAARERHVSHRQSYSQHPNPRPMGLLSELLAVKKNGQTIPVEISLSPARIDGQLSIIVSIRDATERKQREQLLQRQTEDLARSNKELERFAYIASHDLQEPLRMVSSYVQLLGRRYKGKLDVDADEFIHFAVDGANRMQALINDLLDYSRVGRGEMKYKMVDIEEIVLTALSNLQPQIQENNAVVDYTSMPKLYGLPIELTRLFQNLISNAIKYRSERPLTIHISCRDEGDQWRFGVADNGIGIEPQHHRKIFEVFRRLHAKHDYPGTGIGLAVCQKIATLHDGKIWVESSFGEGSEFIFTISKRLGDAINGVSDGESNRNFVGGGQPGGRSINLGSLS